MDRPNWNHHMNYYQSYDTATNNLQQHSFPTDPKYHAKTTTYNNSCVPGTFESQNGMMVNYPVYPSSRFCSNISRQPTEQVHKPPTNNTITYPNNYYSGNGNYCNTTVSNEQNNKTYYDLSSNSCHFAQQPYNVATMYQKTNRTDWKSGNNYLIKSSFPTNSVPPYYQNTPITRSSDEITCNTNKHAVLQSYTNNYHVGRPAEPTNMGSLNMNYPPYVTEGPYHHEYQQYVKPSSLVSRPADLRYEYYNQKAFYQTSEYAQRHALRSYYGSATYQPKAATIDSIPDQRFPSYTNYQTPINHFASDLCQPKTYHLQNQTVINNKIDEVQHYYNNSSDQIINQNCQYSTYNQSSASQLCTYDNVVTKETETPISSKDVHHFYSFMSRNDAQTEINDDNNIVPGKTLREFLSSWNDVDDEELPSKHLTNLINNPETNETPAVLPLDTTAPIESTTESVIDSSEINNNYEFSDKDDQIKELHSNFYAKYIKRKRLRTTYFRKNIKIMSKDTNTIAFHHLHMIIFVVTHLKKCSIRNFLAKSTLSNVSFWLMFIHSISCFSTEFHTSKILRNAAAVIRSQKLHHKFSFLRSYFKKPYHKLVKRLLKHFINELPIQIQPLSLEKLCLKAIKSFSNIKYVDSLVNVCISNIHQHEQVNDEVFCKLYQEPAPIIITESLDLNEHSNDSIEELNIDNQPALLQHSVSQDLTLGDTVEVVEENSMWFRKYILVQKYKTNHTRIINIKGLVFFKKNISKKRYRGINWQK